MAISESGVAGGLSRRDRALKRAFDIVAALVGLLFSGWLIVLAAVLATIDTGEWGIFSQERVGRNGRIFAIYKIRTMRTDRQIQTNVTRAGDPRITSLGRFWRKTKIDELPQLVNILLGQMSFVGPRPDVPGFADQLDGADRVILTVRPGITGPATLHFRDEETLLAAQSDPERYNREVIYPHKVRLNRAYVENYGFRHDIVYIWRTVTGSG